MKKLFLIALAAVGMMTANAQQAYEATNFGSNWSFGLDGGATTPLKGHSFFQNMRGVVGAHLQKQITPIYAVGVEGAWGINTSYGMSKTVFDTQYVGAYGAANLMNLFGGYKCAPRFFEMEAVLGAGWGHYFQAHGSDWNWFQTKAGLNFNFNVAPQFTIALKPSVSWNMTDVNVAQTSCAYDARKANFNILVGLTYNFGKGFVCVDAYNADEIAALNAEINNLRAQLDACVADLAASTVAIAAVQSELDACRNKKPEVKNSLETVRYVYFPISSSEISASQMPTVEIIADYMNNHADSNLDVVGYASVDGNYDFNVKLAEARAESVKNALVNKYNVPASRIEAKGNGILEQFKELSWNRVAICTLDK